MELESPKKEVTKEDALRVLQDDVQTRQNKCVEAIRQVLKEHGFTSLEVEHSIKVN